MVHVFVSHRNIAVSRCYMRAELNEKKIYDSLPFHTMCSIGVILIIIVNEKINVFVLFPILKPGGERTK